MKELLNVSKKLLLEKVYGLWVDEDLEGIIKMGEEVFGLDKWKDFRLSVSGGSESSMGRIGMGSIEGFIDELDLFDNMMCDWGGCYRGDFRYEGRDSLFRLLDNNIEDEEFRNEIKNEYNKYYEEDF
jgi:hypothetical protein